ncbi:MAG: hydantoinase B/oxoprolinase family protein, partial [Dehalococcoidia bacterium]|nr:hydantoinase B/oxoprolinase family protein [Dehalococcoidia bacterium]
MPGPYDPVALDIIWNRLISIVNEAEKGLMRTAFSLQITTASDMSCLLMDTKANSIAQGEQSLIAHVCAAPLTAKGMLLKFPAETLEPGDVLITNIPRLTSGHLYDVCVVEPIFCKGKLVALAGGTAHWPDIGGRGSMSDNRSIYEEGLQLPPIKIARRGQFNEEVLDIIRENVRVPRDVIGDFKAQMVGNNLIRTKLIDLIEKQGIEDFGMVSDSILDRSEKAMRNAISQLPDGDYDNEIQLDGMGRTLTMKVTASVRGTGIHVDYAGSSEQSEWPINSWPHYTFTYTYLAVKGIVAHYLPNNSGTMRPVSLSMPENSILNPRPTSGSTSRHAVGMFCCTAVVGAVVKAVPRELQAETLPKWASVGVEGTTASGKPVGGGVSAGGGGDTGMGARHDRDGIHSIRWPGGPGGQKGLRGGAEMEEYRWPARLIEVRQFKPDSGGPGRYRGGCGLETTVMFAKDVSAICDPGPDRSKYPARGVCGGQPGAPGSLFHNGESVADKRVVPITCGDRLASTTPGGGGFGDPLERDPARVLTDVIDEVVSLGEALASYGVVIDAATCRLDMERTAAIRRSRRSERATQAAS